MTNTTKINITLFFAIIVLCWQRYLFVESWEGFSEKTPISCVVVDKSGEFVNEIQSKHYVTLETNYKYQVRFSTGKLYTLTTDDPFYFKGLEIGHVLYFPKGDFRQTYRQYINYGYYVPPYFNVLFDIISFGLCFFGSGFLIIGILANTFVKKS